MSMSAASSSPAPSPQQGAAKAPRVCLNCKRKKKRCDKALPSCGRCTLSFQQCQHEDDLVLPGSGSMPGFPIFPSFQMPSPISNPATAMRQPSQSWSSSGRSLVEVINSADDINSLALGSLLDILENQRGIENAVSLFFGGVNTWFTIVERVTFEQQLEEMWPNLSAEMCALILCMSMISRPPNLSPISTMGDPVYLSARTVLSLAQSRLPMSITLMQAELLVSLYEFSHSMPQQAYLSVGRCFQMSRAFGWHNKLFWSEERQRAMPGDLKLCSILWWAIVNVDSLVNVGYQEQKYPMHTANLGLDFVIPFPEAFDQYLPGSSVYQFQGEAQGFRDSNMDRIDGMACPEANSSWYLSSVLQHLSNPSAFPAVDRNMLSDAIAQNSLQVMSGHWKNGDRSAALGANSIALMKINQPGLLAGVGSLSPSAPNDTRPVDTIRSVIAIVHDSAVSVLQSDARLNYGTVASCGAFALYYASLLLISHGDGALQDADWLGKVGTLEKALKVYAKRWRIADKYAESLNIALANKMNNYGR